MPPWHADPAHGDFDNDLRSERRRQEADRHLGRKRLSRGRSGRSAAAQAVRRRLGDRRAGPDRLHGRRSRSNVPAEGVIDYYHFVGRSRLEGRQVDHGGRSQAGQPGSRCTIFWCSCSRRAAVAAVCAAMAAAAMREAAMRARQDPRHDRPRAMPGGRTAAQGPTAAARFGGDGGGRGGGGIGSGNLIAGYAPGMNPMLATDGTTAMLREGRLEARLPVALHAQRHGRSRTAATWASSSPIPRRSSTWPAARRWPTCSSRFRRATTTTRRRPTATFEHDTLLTNLTPHMHTRGKSFRYEVDVSRRQAGGPARRAGLRLQLADDLPVARAEAAAQGHEAAVHGRTGTTRKTTCRIPIPRRP